MKKQNFYSFVSLSIIAALFYQSTSLTVFNSSVLSTISTTLSSLGATIKGLTSEKPKPEKVELKDQRTENSKTYLNPNGTYTTEISQQPINYEDNGQMKPIDTSLVKDADGYRVEKNTLEVDFDNKSSNLLQITNSEDNTSIDYKVADANKGQLDPIKKDDNEVSYNNYKADTSLNYQVQAGKVKEEIILEKPPADNTFTFELDLGGLKPKPQKDGSILLLNKKNKTSITIEKPFMTDSHQDAPPDLFLSYNIEMQIKPKQGSSYTLTLTADKTWLDDPQRIYPVKIDPTFITQERPVEDTYIYEGTLDTNYGSAGRMYVGAYSDNKRFKSLLKYDLRTVPQQLESQKIIKAELKNILPDYGNDGFLTNINNGSAFYKGKAISRVYKASKPWDSLTATWTNMATNYDPLTEVTASDSTVDNQAFDVTQIVKSFQANPSTNYGFLMDNTSTVKLIDDSLPTNPAWSWVGTPVHSGSLASKVTNTRLAASWKNTGNDYFVPADSNIVAWTNIQSTPAHLSLSLQNYDKWHTSYWGTEDCYIRDGLGNCEDFNYRAGDVPAQTGTWLKLEASAANFGLSNNMINGLFFAALPTGEATFDDVYTYRKLVFHSSESEQQGSAPRLVITYDNDEYGRKGHKTYKEYSGTSTDINNGNLLIENTDLSIKGRGLSTNVTRAYNSYDKNGSRIFGKGFSSYPDSLRVDYNGSIAVLTTQSGALWAYEQNADGSLTRPKGAFDDLIKNEDGTFTLQRKDLSKVEFDSFGRAAREIDKNGNTLTFTYGANSRISKIADASGKETVFSYLTNDKVSKITDFRGREWTYEYNIPPTGGGDNNGDTLDKVTDPLRNSVSYKYDENGNLVGIVNPLGGETKVEYNTDGRVNKVTTPQSLEYPTGNSITIDYTTQNVTDHPGTKEEIETGYTKVIDPKNYEYIYYFNADGMVTVAGEPGGSTKITEAQKPFFPGASVEREIMNEYLVFYTCYKEDYEEDSGAEMDWLDDWADDWEFDDSPVLVPSTCSRKEIDWKKENVWDKAWDPQYAQANIAPPEVSQPLKHGSETYYEYDVDPQTKEHRTYNLLKLVNKDKTYTTYEYDANGNVVKEINHNHEVTDDETLYQNDAQRYKARHKEQSSTYDARNLLLSQTSVSGDTTTFTYDEKGNLLTETDPAGDTTSYTYDSFGNQETKTTPKGNQTLMPGDYTTTNTYNSDGEVTSVTDPEGVTTTYTYTYDAAGNKVVTEQKEGLGEARSTYDKMDRLLIQKDLPNATGGYKETEYEYDAAGNKKLEQIYERDTVTQMRALKSWIRNNFNSSGQVTKQYDYTGEETKFTYDKNGNKDSEQKSNRGPTTYEYDSLNRLTKETKADGSWVAYAYDSFGNIVKEGTPEGTSVNLYDKAGNEVASGDPLGNVTKTLYDKEGNERSTGDGENNITGLNYDVNGNINTVTEEKDTVAVNQTAYQYDPNQNENKVTAPNSTFTTTDHNKADQVNAETDQNTMSTQTSYNTSGLEQIVNQPNNMNQELKYDTAGNNTEVNAQGTTSTSANVNNQYDWNSNRTTTSTFDQNNKEVTKVTNAYDYGSLDNRLASINDKSNRTLNYDYNLAGDIISTDDPVDPLGKTLYTYDNLVGKLMGVTDGNNKTTTFAYDKAGKSANISKITYPNTTQTSLEYDAASKVTSVSNSKTGQEQNTYRYYYDRNGNIIKTNTYDPNNLVDYFQDDFSVFNPLYWNTANVNAYQDPVNGYMVLQGDDTYAPPVDNWFDQAWSRRASVLINNIENPNNLTDYQVKVEVDYQSGMKSDFSDLRFTDSDKITELPYWIEKSTPSTSATVWIKMPSIAAESTKLVYVYFGNPSATNASNGNDVFAAFDVQGLKGFWKFDEGIGIVANDQTGLNNGVLINNLSWVNGKYGQALNFDGDINGDGLFVGESGERVTVPNSSSLSINGNQMTMASWVKLGSTGWGHSVIEKWYAYALRVETNVVTVYFQGLPPNNHFQFPVNLERNRWYHITATYDGQAVNLYIDGQNTGSIATSGNIVTSTSEVWIGANLGGGQLTGDIDEVLITDTALSSQAVNGLYKGNLQKIGNVYSARQETVVEPTAVVNTATSLKSWYNEDWVKRAPVEIDNSKNSQTLTDYQVKMEVPYEMGMKSDFSDLRFTDSDKITELNYWIEEKTDSSKATVWIKAPNIAANSTKTIYMYYGNSNATSASNVDKTLDFYDDFNSEAIDANKWGTDVGGDGAITINNGSIRQRAVNGWAYIYTKRDNYPISGNIVVERRFQLNPLSNQGYRQRLWIGGAGLPYDHGIFDNETVFWNGWTSRIVPSGSWLTLEQKIIGQSLLWNIQGVFIGLGPVIINAPYNIQSSAGQQGSTAQSGDITTDWIKARKYTSIEPSVSLGKAYSNKAWFNEDWSKRAEINIDNSKNSQALTDYQVKVKVPYIQGIQSDFDDLRFTNSDKITELSYWIEEKKLAEYATVWIKIPQIKANEEKTIYMYYSNPSIASTSDGASTFEMFNVGGLQSFWKFDEESYSGQIGEVKDETNSNNGTSYSGLTTTNNSKFGKAASFDGIDDYISIGNSPSLDLSQAVTFEAWVYPTNASSDEPVIAKEKPGDLAYWFGVYGNGFGLLLDNGSNNWSLQKRSSGSISNNEWQHIVSTWDGATWKNYKNGLLIEQGQWTGPIAYSAAPLTIGSNSDSKSTNFNGSIDEVKIYNRALTSNEVAALSNNFLQKMGDNIYNARKYVQNEPKVSLNLNWWNEDWLKRSAVTIDNAENSSTLTDYQLKMTVDYKTGMQSDFSDIRFTDADHLTELSYWIEEKTDATSATVWVKVPEIKASSTKDIYMYYSNPNVGSASDGKATFKEFDVQGIKGSWKFDEEVYTGAVGEVKDETNTNNGNASGGLTTTTSAKYGKAAYFDGFDDYINIGTSSSLVMTKALSMEAWIYPTSDKDGIIVNKEGEYEIARFSDGTIRFAIDNTSLGWAWVNSNYIAPLNTWTHLVCTYSADTGLINVYANGVQVYSTSGSGYIGDIEPDKNDFRIGGRQNTGSEFNGLIDEVKIYNKALTPNEISTRYGNYLHKVNNIFLTSSYTQPAPKTDISQSASLRDWYNPDWKSRTIVTIDNNNSKTLTDYQIKATVLYKAGMKSDFSDLRFTDSDKIAELPYWVERKTDSTSATVWIKVPRTPAVSTKTLYMYYANPNAISTSNGNAVFEAFDVQGVKGFWKLDESAGVTAYDQTGINNGTLINTPTRISGVYGNGLNFDGDINGDGLFVGESGERVTVPNSSSLSINGNQMTMASWVKLGSTGWGHSVIEKWYAYALRVETNVVTVYFQGLPPNNHFQFPVNLERNRWYHITATYDGQAVNLYIDGQNTGSIATSGNIVTSTSEVWIGANLGGGQLTGDIDEVLISDKALTSQQVNGLYTGNLQKRGSIYNAWKYVQIEPKVTVGEGSESTTDKSNAALLGTKTFSRDLFPSIKLDFLTDRADSLADIVAEGYDGKKYRSLGLVFDNGTIKAQVHDGAQRGYPEAIILKGAQINTWYTAEFDFSPKDAKLYVYKKGDPKPVLPAYTYTEAGWNPNLTFLNYRGKTYIDNVDVKTKARSTYYAYDDFNRLTKVAGQTHGEGSATYTYDEQGNRLTKINSSGTTDYSYVDDDPLTNDLANELKKVTSPNGDTTKYTYDANGNTATKVDSSGTTSYTHDNKNQLVKVKKEYPDSDNKPDKWYTGSLTASDGRSTEYVKEGKYSFKFTGETTKYKYAGQLLPVSGKAGDEFALTGYNKTIGSSTTGGTIGSLVYFLNTDGTWSYTYMYFSKGPHDWEYQSKVIKASKDFTNVYVYLLHYTQTGTAYFDNFEFSKLSGFKENLTNASFETDSDANKIPDGFSAYGFGINDGQSSDYYKEGAKSLKITGETTKYKYLSQIMSTSGKAGEEFSFSGFNKTIGSSATGGTIGNMVIFLNSDGTTSANNMYFSKGPHDWEYQSKVIKASKDFTKIYVYIIYNGQTGTAYFDDFKLTSFGQPLTNASFETDSDANKIPDGFSAYGFGINDGQSTDYYKEGAKSLKITGETAKYKYLAQSVPISGKAKDKLVLSGFNKTIGSSVTGGTIGAMVMLLNSDNTYSTYYMYFSKAAHDWEYQSALVEAKKDFVSANFYVMYWAQTGTGYFDDFKLRRFSSSQLLKQPSFELDSDVIDYVYDGKGNRYSKTITKADNQPVATFYHYDKDSNIVSETDANNNLKVRYVRDTGGKAISMIQGANTYYFIYNGHGDVTALTDSTGTVVATYSYDEFGNITSTTGNIYNPIRYSGAHNAYYDSETGLYKMGARYYQPDVGRWLTRDSYKGEKTQPALFNKYVYVLNNPTTNVDPTGNKPVAPRKHKKQIEFIRGAKDNRIAKVTMHRINLRYSWVYDGNRVVSNEGWGWYYKKPWWNVEWFNPWQKGANWGKTSAGFSWTNPLTGTRYQNNFETIIYGYADGRWEPGGYSHIDSNPFYWRAFTKKRVKQLY